MRIHVLEIPDDHSERIDWLQSQLVGHQFGELLEQLFLTKISLNRHVSSVPLSEILSDSELESVLKSGLQRCSSGTIRQLLANPAALSQLQELIFVHGNDFWMNKIKPSPHEESVLEMKGMDSTVFSVPKTVTQLGKKTKGFHRQWQSLITLATLVLLAVGLTIYLTVPGFNNQRANAWGWLAEKRESETLTSAQYFLAIADQGQEWFDARPIDSEGFKQRLGQLIQGCEKLIVASHSPLNKSQSDWLVERCETWKAKFEETLAQVSQHPEDWRTELSNVDSVVAGLVTSLREQSATL